MEKRLKLVLYNQDIAAYVLFPLVLLQSKADLVLEEKRGKKNLVRPLSSSNNKVVLTLLIEVVILYIRLFVANI